MVIYENILEAVREIAPQSPLLQLTTDGRLFKRTNRYEMVDMGNGRFGAFPNLMVLNLYRGESDKYSGCEASIFRNNRNGDGSYNVDRIIVDSIKIVDFELILMGFPQVNMALDSGANVDFLALAQHYELNTSLLDATSEPEIAAYFATQRWKNGVLEPAGDGLGCLRIFPVPFMDEEALELSGGRNPYPGKYHMIGLQCFKRPGLQCAYGFETAMGEDVSGYGSRMYFKQDAGISRAIRANFHTNEKTRRIEPVSWLFPNEEAVEAANRVKRTNAVTQKAATLFCSRNGVAESRVAEALDRERVFVRKSPVFRLTNGRVRELIREYSGRPFGDVDVRFRAVYYPNH